MTNHSPVLSKFDSPNILLVDEVRCHTVFCWVMPRGKNFLPEEESPRCVPLLSPLLFRVLLTL